MAVPGDLDHLMKPDRWQGECLAELRHQQPSRWPCRALA